MPRPKPPTSVGTLNRRDFLRSSLWMGAGGLCLFSGASPLLTLARAQAATTLANPDRYFVFCYFEGGWDILLSLDPRDPALFRPDNRGATGIDTGYNLLPAAYQQPINVGGINLGPYIGEMRDCVGDMCIVRGLSMETLTHEVGRRRFITGQAPSGLNARGSAIATRLAAQTFDSEWIPNIAVQVESYNVDLPSQFGAMQVNGVGDLLAALRPGTAQLPTEITSGISQFLELEAGCDESRRSLIYRLATESRAAAGAMTALGLDHDFDFLATTPEMNALRAHYGIGSDLAALNSPEARAALAAEALVNGVSRCISFRANAETLDTHFDNWARRQGPAQERGFNAVARLAKDLKSREYKGTGTSWLDHTTIVGFSEFSRTATLNPSSGRDHSLTNACFLMGAGVKHGVVVGRSSDTGMTPVAIDLTTGQSAPDGTQVRPEHIWQALFDSVGSPSDAGLAVRPLKAILA